MGSLVFLILLASMQVGQIFGQKGVPQFTNTSALNNRYLNEDFTVGNVVGTIEAFDPDGTEIQYFIEGEGGEYFQIGRKTGVVSLKKELEFDTDSEDREIRMTVIALDENQQQSVFYGKVFIQDVNDIPPDFERYDIFLTIPEDAQPGLLVATISVRDVDTTNDILSVQCLGESEAFKDACDKFALSFKPSEISNKGWIGELRLAKPLDYEERISYAIPLVAKDGRFSVTNEVHIEVQDINDSPPIWTRVPPVTINEEEIIGTFITEVTARDGDVTRPRDISYELIETVYDDGAKFSINNITGEITNAARLDYDSKLHRKNVPYEVKVRAREVISNNPLKLGDDAVTTSTTVVSITVRDIDDNTPTFNQKEYTAFIPENIVTSGNIPGLQMTITDIDSGTFNSFDLVTLNFQDVFAIVPNNGQANAGATLFIKDSEKIDYENGPREYVINIEARENQVSRPLTGSATVTVKVEDVNDQDPRFPKETYYRSLPETANAGTLVIKLDATDNEAGNFGTAGIRYKLFGNQQNHFQIDEVTGALTVSQCPAPGKPGLFPCIDYERKKQYVLTVSATDDLGRGRTRSVQVIVAIEDMNDNVPKPKDEYFASIYEEQTEPVLPLIIKAEDPDSVGGPVNYELSGDPDIIGNWRIENTVDDNGESIGIITARRPVQYSWAQDPQRGTLKFAVLSSDQKDVVSSDVTILIIDINNNQPEFSIPTYEATIREDTQGDVSIISVTASDGDAPTTGNGILDFSIESGGFGKFTVKSYRQENDRYVAEIYTSPDATFNYDQIKKFTMTLVARDQGTPESKRGRAELIVNIIDINNNDPQITPTSVSISVAENLVPNTQVHQVIAIDPDNTANLHYYMTPTRAQNPSGAVVDKNDFDYTDLFRIEETTGIVRVNKPLNREITSFIVNSLIVIDKAAKPEQTGTGALFITITEVNDQDPIFDLPLYNITIDEELNVNFFVRNLHCSDADDQISRYQLSQIEPRSPSYFNLMDASGSLIVADRIDFEKIEQITLQATCYDDGTPQRFGTTDILINVRNINDNSPEFTRQLYTATIDETREGEDIGGKQIVVVSATDIDKGDFGIVRYKMANPKDPFLIDPENGVITVKPGAKFDRELSASNGFQVIAYDSPNTPDKRKETTVPVYLTINDINDNCPQFKAKIYSGSIPESAKTGTDVVDTLAFDKDYGINQQIVYTVQKGSFVPPEGEGYFDMGIKSGRVYTKSTLTGKSGEYRFNITATDTAGTLPDTMCSTHVPVIITVSQSQNYAPNWIDPPQRDWVIYVLESQYEGMLVYDSKAEDLDPGRSGIVDYYFVEGNNHVAATREFRINQVTGIIRAEIEFDREKVDRYFLTLVAVDQGATTASSETTLIVVIMDVDDNDPTFETKDGQVAPLVLPEFDLPEDQAIPTDGRKVGQCQATDLDSDHKNNRIYYEILAENEELSQTVHVNRDTCEIRLMKQIDYDKTPQLEFNILAFNEKNDDSVKRHKRDINRSILPVVIKIQDANDNGPVFTQSEYFACAPLTSPFRSPIIDLDAHDVEQDDVELRYSLQNTNNFEISNLGIVYNLISFPSTSQKIFRLTAVVNDGKNTATARVNVFVSSASNQIMFTVNRPSSDVRRVKQEYEQIIKDSLKGARFACADVQNHINSDGTLSSSKSDVYMSIVYYNAATDSYEFMSGNTVYDLLSSDKSKNPQKYDVNFIAGISAVEEDNFGLDEDVVLIILIITIILIVLAIILMVVACYCIWARTQKKKRRVKTQQHMMRHSGAAAAKEESFSNPVYNNAGYVAYEDEYSSISKSKKETGPITPVVIPAPQNLEPMSTFSPSNLEPEEDEGIQTPPEIPEPVIETEEIHTAVEVPEPVIETEVMPEVEPPSPPAVHHTHLEYEDPIETVVEEEHDIPLPSPPVLETDHQINTNQVYQDQVYTGAAYADPIDTDQIDPEEIITVIRSDSPLPSLRD